MRTPLTLVILLLAGCLQHPGEEVIVSIPAAPATVEAVYDFRAGGRSVGEARITGIGLGAAIAADGGRLEGTEVRVEVRLAEFGEDAAYRYSLLLARDGLLAGGRLECSGPLCRSRGDVVVEMPVVAGTPSFLGAGPFQGKIHRPGEVVGIGGDERGGSAWALESAPSWQSRPCLRATPTGPPPGIALPLAPAGGTLLLCEGIPIPVTVDLAGTALHLREVRFDATLPAPQLTGVARTDPGPCSGVLPVRDVRTLPSTGYLAWARQHDPEIRDALAADPKLGIYEGYGRWLGEESPSPLDRYPVTVLLPFFSPERRFLDARMGTEVWTRTPLGSQGAMEPSTALGGGARAGPPVCRGSAELAPMTERILKMTGMPLQAYSAFLAPRSMAAFQGYSAPLGPFSLFRDLPSDGTEPAPVRAYVMAVPRDRGLLTESVHASFNPASGALEWMERSK